MGLRRFRARTASAGLSRDALRLGRNAFASGGGERSCDRGFDARIERVDAFGEGVGEVTVPANQLIMPVSDRMPAFLHMEDWPMWLGEEEATPGQLKAMLKTVEGVRWTMEREKKAPKSPPPKKPTSPKATKPQSELF